MTAVGDLKIDLLGHDKEILEKLQQDPNSLKTNGNGLRDNYPYTKSSSQTSGVNRVLFRSENDEENNEEETWNKARSETPDSDEGLTFGTSDPSKNSPLGRPLPVLEESPVTKMNQLVSC